MFKWLGDLLFGPVNVYDPILDVPYDEEEEDEEEDMTYYDDEIDIGVNDGDGIFIRITNDYDEIDRAISMSPAYARTLANRLIMLADTTEQAPFKGNVVAKGQPAQCSAKESVDDLGMLIDTVIISEPENWLALKRGKKGLLGFFVGLALKDAPYAKPQLVVEEFQKRLES